jgi:DNA adenine methylase
MSIPSPVLWFGSKSRLAARIIEHFPKHKIYVEPFGGSAALLLAKEPSGIEVFNDIDGELVNFFRVLRDPKLFPKLRQAVENTLYARVEFELAKQKSDDPVEAARRFMVRQRQSRAGLGQQWSFSLNYSRRGMAASASRWQGGIGYMPAAHKRFQNVQIECADWRVILSRYDSPETLFYLDAPYHPDTRIGGEYQHELTTEDHRELAGRLLALEGMVVLSCYDHASYKPLERAGWRQRKYDVCVSSSDRKTRRVESLWLSPSVSEHKPKIYLTPIERMRAGAFQTHSLRVKSTTNRVLRAVAKLRENGERITIARVARTTKMSREHLSRKYGDLFRV